jgi:hypothetical protein
MNQHPYVMQLLAERRIEDLHRDGHRYRHRRTPARTGSWTRRRHSARRS